MKPIVNIPELLAPAGNAETAVAAYDAGADAVYCGLGKFNARERAENFTTDTLGRVIEFAHSRGRKLYLTFNTLIKEGELPQVVEALGELVKLGPDAVIVQDLGVIELARRYFPTLKLHASTQMGIHNSAGVAAAARIGVERVILERQLTLEELRRIAALSSVELEVFCHGSLCCSLSGRCLLSSALGGWSGNRGKCKQPCRRNYEIGGKSKFALSPRDLFGIELVSEFRRLGIASLKVEGRLRSPDYVWKTVKAYRMVLDGPVDTPPELLDEAYKMLRSTASRRPSNGFFYVREYNSLIDADKLGSFGNVVAEVEKKLRNGLLVKTSDRLHLGDRLRLVPPDGGEGSSFSLIRLEEHNASVVRVRANSRCFLPGEFFAAPGWLVYKIGENGFDFSRQAASLPPPRHPVDLSLELSASRWRVSTGKFEWYKQVDFAPAEQRPLSAERVEAEFRAAVPEPWSVGTLKIKLTDSFFVPASVLKQLRREFWEYAVGHLDLADVHTEIPEALAAFYFDYQRTVTAVPLPEAKRVWVIPGFIAEGKLQEEREKVAAAYGAGIRRFWVGGLHGFEFLRDFPDVEIVAVFPLPVTNSRATLLLQELGAVGAEMEPELDLEAGKMLVDHSFLPLFRGKGELPLLATRLRLPTGIWRDGRGRTLEVRFDPTEGLSKIYSQTDVRSELEKGEWL